MPIKTAGAKPFGMYALNSMRMEKGYRHWKADLITEFDPFETGLDRFVDFSKQDFVGKAALVKRHASGPTKKLVSMVVDSTDAAAHGGASVMVDGRVVGTVSSGDYGHRTGLNIAYAFMDPVFAAPDTALHIDMLGELLAAKVIPVGPSAPPLLTRSGPLLSESERLPFNS